MKKVNSENITTVGELIETLQTMPPNARVCGSTQNRHDEYDCEIRPFWVKRYYRDADDDTDDCIVYVGLDYKHPN